MEENKTIFSFINQIFATFGVIVLIFVVLGMTVAEDANMYSSLFKMGRGGYSIETLAQLFFLSVFITAGQVIFLTDKWIKNMSLVFRSICFILSVVIVIIAFVCAFSWFPIDNIHAWISFFVSFTVCTGAGIFLGRMKEQAENKKMEQALEKIRKDKS